MSPAAALGYTCHDAFPAATINTHQIFWTLLETARLGADVRLTVPAIAAASQPVAPAEIRRRLADFYGAAADTLPERFSIAATGRAAPRSAWGKARFDLTIASRIRTERHDLVWTRDLVAAAACVRAGLPVLFETYRLDLATSWRFGWWRRLVFGSRLGRDGTPAAGLRGLIVHSRLAAAAFAGAGVDPARCLVAYNGIAPLPGDQAEPPAVARRALGLREDRRLVVYAGTVGAHKGTDILLDLAVELADHGVDVLLIGVEPGSTEEVRLTARIQAIGAANVRLHPRVRAAEVGAYLRAADCLIIPPTAAPLRKYRSTVLPIKVFTYLAAGRPIVAPCLPDIEEILRDGRSARLVPPDAVGTAAAAIRGLLSDPEMCRRLGAHAREQAVRFTWPARAARILDFVERIRG